MSYVDLPDASFVAQVYRGRLSATFTPTMFVSGLVQYNSSTRTLGSNVRFGWEYERGSELFVACTEDQDRPPSSTGVSRPPNRALAVKVTRLLRF